METKTNTLQNHAKNKNFGKTDNGRSWEKYQDYKPLFVKRFFEDNAEQISEYLEGLSWDIENEFFSKPYTNYLYSDLTNGKINKKLINQIFTTINNFTYNRNADFIKDLGENLNPNEIRSLAIIFYLRNYNKINAEMKDAFLNLILESVEEFEN